MTTSLTYNGFSQYASAAINAAFLKLLSENLTNFLITSYIFIGVKGSILK